MKRKELINNIKKKRSFLCVGLDTDLNKIPPHLLEVEDPIYTFNKAIIDSTAPYCVAFKPNIAFYENNGIKGIWALEKTIEYIRTKYPDQLIILDSKRGDIGNTSNMYANAAFVQMKASAITVAPYMGIDSVEPFLKHENKWVILLALTSNKGSLDFQMIEDKDGLRLFEKVLIKSQEWGSEDQLMYVVGATRGSLFKDVRKHVPNHFLLVPGVGAQGGSLAEVVEFGMNKDCGLLVNSSRAIIYADNTENYAIVAGQEANKMQQEMDIFLKQID